MLNWNSRLTWIGLTILVLALGVTWIVFSKVPPETVAARAASSPLPRKGFPAPDFTLETTDGQMITLSDLQGQVVLINFWASWCKPCREEMPAIQQVYVQHGEQDFVVLAVNLRESDEQVAAFAQRLELTFPILMDRNGSVFDRYRVVTLPTTFLLNRTGLIQDVAIGGPLSRAYIESLVSSLLAQEGRDQ